MFSPREPFPKGTRNHQLMRKFGMKHGTRDIMLVTHNPFIIIHMLFNIGDASRFRFATITTYLEQRPVSHVLVILAADSASPTSLDKSGKNNVDQRLLTHSGPYSHGPLVSACCAVSYLSSDQVSLSARDSAQLVIGSR